MTSVIILSCRKRYVKMRESLVRFRSYVRMYVNRKQYIKVLVLYLLFCVILFFIFLERLDRIFFFGGETNAKDLFSGLT